MKGAAWFPYHFVDYLSKWSIWLRKRGGNTDLRKNPNFFGPNSEGPRLGPKSAAADRLNFQVSFLWHALFKVGQSQSDIQAIFCSNRGH